MYQALKNKEKTLAVIGLGYVGLPIALEHWTNEQVLNFMHLMWEQSNQRELDEERELDPLHFLPEGVDLKLTGPLDASTVVEVAKRAFSSLGDYGESVFMRPHNFHHAFDSPLTEDAIMVEVGTAAAATSTGDSRGDGCCCCCCHRRFSRPFCS